MSPIRRTVAYPDGRNLPTQDDRPVALYNPYNMTSSFNKQSLVP